MRNDLGDLDESQWEDGRDPWQMNDRIIMQDMEGGLVTFSTQSTGGRRACDDLLNLYFKDKDHEDLWPVVKIGTTYFNSREYGSIAKPAFTIVGWDEPWAEPSGDLLADTKKIEAPRETPEAPSFERELDDEIPF